MVVFSCQPSGPPLDRLRWYPAKLLSGESLWAFGRSVLLTEALRHLQAGIQLWDARRWLAGVVCGLQGTWRRNLLA